MVGFKDARYGVAVAAGFGAAVIAVYERGALSVFVFLWFHILGLLSAGHRGWIFASCCAVAGLQHMLQGGPKYKGSGINLIAKNLAYDIVLGVLALITLVISDVRTVPASTLQLLDAGGVFISVAVLCKTLSTPKQALALAEFTGLAIVLSDQPASFVRATHLTWWGMALLAILDMLTVVRLESRINLLQAIIAATVTAGTIFMSLAQCGVLLDAYKEMGAISYIAGNIVVHYYPLLRAIDIRANMGVGPSKNNLDIATRTSQQMAAAICVVVAYTSVIDPAETYGCDIGPLSGVLLLPAVTVAIIGAMHY